MSCVFCEIVNKGLPATIVNENDSCIAFTPLEIEVDGHLVVIHKEHYSDLMDIPAETLSTLMKFVKETCNNIAERFGFSGFNLLHASGASAQQSVNHFHIHILPRKENDSIDAWPNLSGGTNIYIAEKKSRISLSPAKDDDFDFAFETKKQAMGPHIVQKWGWDDDVQKGFHSNYWNSKPWLIISINGEKAGTVSIEQKDDHIRFGEFYILDRFRNQGIGTQVLKEACEQADRNNLPIRLEYLKWNPVGSLYKRFGFKQISENEIHYFMERVPR